MTSPTREANRSRSHFPAQRRSPFTEMDVHDGRRCLGNTRGRQRSRQGTGTRPSTSRPLLPRLGRDALEARRGDRQTPVVARDLRYNGIANSISRTSPALAQGLVLVADLNGNMMGIDAATGELRWLTELDPNPNTIVTTSPVVHGNTPLSSRPRRPVAVTRGSFSAGA